MKPMSIETQRELVEAHRQEMVDLLMPWAGGVDPFSMPIDEWLAHERERLGLPRAMIAGDLYPARAEMGGDDNG